MLLLDHYFIPYTNSIFILTRTQVNMSGEYDSKWLVAGGRRRAKRRQDAGNSKLGEHETGSRSGGLIQPQWQQGQVFCLRGIGHLLQHCPSRSGANLSHGKQAAGSPYRSLSNVSTTASSNSGSKKPPPTKKHPRVGPS